MNNLANKITAYLGSKPDFIEEVKLQDDMVDGVSNPYIKEWNITEKPKPTDAELNEISKEINYAFYNFTNFGLHHFRCN